MSIYFARNFKFAEIMCPCGCRKIKPIDPKLTYLLQSLREKINRPIYIIKGGGLRCKKYNRKSGGYKNSAHLFGKAVDIHAKNMSLIQLAKEAKDIGFTRIGIYVHNGFIHVDTYAPRPSASWLRNENGIYSYFLTLEDAINSLKIK